MMRRPPTSTPTATPFPYPTRFRSLRDVGRRYADIVTSDAVVRHIMSNEGEADPSIRVRPRRGSGLTRWLSLPYLSAPIGPTGDSHACLQVDYVRCVHGTVRPRQQRRPGREPDAGPVCRRQQGHDAALAGQADGMRGVQQFPAEGTADLRQRTTSGPQTRRAAIRAGPL